VVGAAVTGATGVLNKGVQSTPYASVERVSTLLRRERYSYLGGSAVTLCWSEDEDEEDEEEEEDEDTSARAVDSGATGDSTLALTSTSIVLTFLLDAGVTGGAVVVLDMVMRLGVGGVEVGIEVVVSYAGGMAADKL
jgi:hypothetical protein